MRKIYNTLKGRVLAMGVFALLSTVAFAQKGTIQGVISDANGSLIGATVVIEGTSIGTTTDFDGSYSLTVDPGTYTVDVSYVGYANMSEEVTVGADETVTQDFTMVEGEVFEEIVVIGSRAPARTNTRSAVPVDVINVSQLATSAPQTTVNELLTVSAPSFNSNTQTISDGTDHIDPASLRGLGPDQVLVLLNGKRRHTTSLVNVNGTFGRGNVGTDLNAIPATAIRNIQVLRDGAAAQYGSDAIAGVINVDLRRDVNKLNLNVTTGANFTDGEKIGPFLGEDQSVDGEKVVLGVNYGLPIGENGGFVNFTGEFDYRAPTNRMREFQGGIFNRYNTVERLARGEGLNVANLSLEDANRLSQEAGFTTEDLELGALQEILVADNTDAELAARGQVRSDYNMRVGQSAGRGGKFFANMAIPLGEDLEFYSFGGLSYRNGESGCFYRLPSQNRTVTAIYEDGHVPFINSNISDKSISVGVRGKINDWDVDFSNTYGTNEFLFNITNSANASYGVSSPTSFESGGHAFGQNTANVDIAQYFEEVGGLTGVSVAFGSEYRYENYNITPGTELSYGNYDVNNVIVTPVTPSEQLTRDFLGRARPSGAQCFAGFLPTNFVDARRSSVAGYGDVEVDFTEDFMMGAAVRFENYSDFGSTFNYKLVGRYSLSDNINLRGGFSTGFRAPSLHQIHFSRTSTIFELVDGVSIPQEVGVFANTSRAANLLGIPELKEETSQNYSLGLTAKVPAANLTITVDAFQVDIDDRVVLTGQFTTQDGNGNVDPELVSIFQNAGATRASFFANAIGTRTQGLDIVLSHVARFGSDNSYSFKSDLAGTFSRTTADTDDEGNVMINASDILEEKGLVGTYFDQVSRLYLENAVPLTKITLSNSLNMGAWNVYLRNTYFGKTIEATDAPVFESTPDGLEYSSAMAMAEYGRDIDVEYSPKIITDLSLGYQFNENLTLTVGANNLLDVYPDESDELFQSGGRFIYSRRSPQFSMNGRYGFARLTFTLD